MPTAYNAFTEEAGFTNKEARALAARELWERNVFSTSSFKITPEEFSKIQFQLQTPEERQEMTWTNPEAADIAREILTDAKREGLREKITEAVGMYRKMLEDAHCGSVFSFMKLNNEGKHYWYAAIKNGDKWYTTAQNPRIINSDDEFITWLISLGAHESQAAELTAGAGAMYAPEAIEASVTVVNNS